MEPITYDIGRQGSRVHLRGGTTIEVREHPDDVWAMVRSAALAVA